jgi:sortase A
MPLYQYVKLEPRRSSLEPKNWLKILPIFSIITGLILVGSVVYPVLSYQLLTTPRFQSKLLSPLADSTSFSPVVLGEEMDLTRIANWFPSAPKQVKISSRITDYTLTIPKLKIHEATVKIGGESLGESLVHYGGTAIPGESGNTVIFGHSVLPHLFNPRNYLTIFSTLPTLKTGDAIYVNYDVIEYKYQIFEMIEVGPNDVRILGQRYDRSILTLVTCVPPGTYWRRLAVKAKLEKV